MERRHRTRGSRPIWEGKIQQIVLLLLDEDVLDVEKEEEVLLLVVQDQDED